MSHSVSCVAVIFSNKEAARLFLFTCRRSGGAEEAPRGGRLGGRRLSEAIVPGRGGGQAAALLRCSRLPIQAGNQKQRRQKEQQRRRRQVAFSSGHGERGDRLKDIPNRERREPRPARFVLITKASSLSCFGGCWG